MGDGVTRWPSSLDLLAHWDSRSGWELFCRGLVRATTSAAISASVGFPLTMRRKGLSILASQGDVAVLFGRKGGAFFPQHGEGTGNVTAGVGRGDNRVDVTPFGGNVRVAQGVFVFLL